MTIRTNTPLGDDERLPVDITGLDRLSRPVWVFDPVAERKLYANPSAVTLWGADDLTALRARDFSVKSEAARTRTALTFDAVRAGEQRSEIWTFYPKGVPVWIRAVASHMPLRDGSSAILFEASKLEEQDTDYLRALDAMRQAGTPISLYDEDGVELFGNPCAARTYGARRRFEDRCEAGKEARSAWAAGAAGFFNGRLWMNTDAGLVCHDVSLQRTVDPITGRPAILSYESDDTSKIETEAKLAIQIAALEHATAEANAANEAKSVFLANMSHELRTPLNGVVSLADLLCRTDLTPTQREAAELIRTSGRSLADLLADILQLAQIEAGEIEIVARPFDVAGVAKDVADLLRLRAEESGSTLDLRIDLPAGDGRLGDELRFRQVLMNLAGNAVKFTSKGATTVVIAERGPGIRVVVTDTGIGFDNEQKGRIFERFQQADGSITRRFGGSGLGLAITASLVERMGGTIDCESTVGVGSRFWADLPFEAVDLARPATVDPTVGDLEGAKVLVADDHPVNRRVMEMILEPLGAAVVAVTNGAEAVEAVQDEPFDVVLMDMQMPVMDGLEATRKIVDAAGPPVIMVSANALPQHMDAAAAAGAVAFVTKPIQPAAMVEAVIETLDTHAARNGAAEQGPRVAAG